MIKFGKHLRYYYQLKQLGLWEMAKHMNMLLH